VTARLEVRGLNAHYGLSHVLQGIDLTVEPDQVVALFGRNGVGKSTLVHTIAGLHRPSSGSVSLDGRDLAGRPPHEIARAGIALVPQGRRVFAPLTVEENLRLATRARGQSNGAWTLDRVYELLPRLAERRRNHGDQLSGGEQQMLVIGRALLRNPSLVLLDEPSDGLAPRLVEQVADVLSHLRTAGIPALLVEQNLRMALGLADVVMIMTKGRIAYTGSVSDFRHSPETARALLGVG
jgi:branched-chain amino acid transport system ATP-binding protein